MKIVTHRGGTFSTTDTVAEALVALDHALRSADTVARVELPSSGALSETLWIHLMVGDRVPLVVSSDNGRDVEAPLPVVVQPGSVRSAPIDVQSIIDEQSFPYGHDWM